MWIEFQNVHVPITRSYGLNIQSKYNLLGHMQLSWIAF